MLIRLTTRDGGFVGEFKTAPFLTLPEVVNWGSRHFTLIPDTDPIPAQTMPTYREAFCLMLAAEGGTCSDNAILVSVPAGTETPAPQHSLLAVSVGLSSTRPILVPFPAEPYEPQGIRFYDERTRYDMLLVADGEDMAGWLCYRHPDGQWVSIRKATEAEKIEIKGRASRSDGS